MIRQAGTRDTVVVKSREMTGWSQTVERLRLIETHAKCRYLKKFTCKGALRQVFIYLRPPPLLGFCLGWSSNFVGSESGKMQNVELLQDIVSQHSSCSTPPPPPPSHTLYVYTVRYSDTGKGGRGKSSPCWVENTNMIVSPVL
jgi:hypothetical protein